MRTYYRIVRGEEPTVEDFWSLRAQGKALSDPAIEREWAEGVSVFDDFESACAVARRYGFHQGTFVVAVVVPNDVASRSGKHSGTDIIIQSTLSRNGCWRWPSNPRYASLTRLEKRIMEDYVELYDLRSGNLMANFDDEHEAWEKLREMAVEFGLEEIEGLGLSQVRDGKDTLIAMEDDLVQRVAHQLDLEPVGGETRR